VIDADRAEPYYPGNDECLVSFLMPHEEFVARFGAAHRQMDERDSEPGPCEYWAFRFPCGLSVFLVYHPTRPPAPGCYVYADRPDIDHVLQHIGLSDRVEWRLDYAHPDVFRERHGVVAVRACPSASGVPVGATGIAAGASDRSAASQHLFGTVQTHHTKAELAAAFAAAGWTSRKCTWTDYDVQSDFAELVIESDDPMLIHGPVTDVIANVDRIAEVLRSMDTKFLLECQASSDGELLRKVEG
jgi:hypothetical protein